MARILFIFVAILLIVIMFSSESKSLPVGENSPATIFDGQFQLNEILKNERQCKKIGERCSRHEECCSKRCPSYWAKCVS